MARSMLGTYTYRYVHDLERRRRQVYSIKTTATFGYELIIEAIKCKSVRVLDYLYTRMISAKMAPSSRSLIDRECVRLYSIHQIFRTHSLIVTESFHQRARVYLYRARKSTRVYTWMRTSFSAQYCAVTVRDLLPPRVRRIECMSRLSLAHLSTLYRYLRSRMHLLVRTIR